MSLVVRGLISLVVALMKEYQNYILFTHFGQAILPSLIIFVSQSCTSISPPFIFVKPCDEDPTGAQG